MLWNTIYEFFVKYVFGGYSTREGITYSAIFGPFFKNEGLYDPDMYTSDALITLDNLSIADVGSPLQMPLSNYLCFIATIISITVIVVLCCLFVYKIIKLIGGLIR